MYPTTYLEWLFKGRWERIGWTADTPESEAELHEHGAALSESGGRYRLVQPSAYAGEEPRVTHTFPEQHPEEEGSTITLTAKVCGLEHGGPRNAAVVYGHHGTNRTCVRLGKSLTWVYDPRKKKEN